MRSRSVTCPLVRMGRLGDHVLLKVPPEPGQVRLLCEEELVLLPPREDLDQGPVAGHGHAAVDGLPRNDGVSMCRLEHPHVEQLAELEKRNDLITVKSEARQVCVEENHRGLYLVFLVGNNDPLQRSGEVLAERCTVRRPDLLPLGRAPGSQEEA